MGEAKDLEKSGHPLKERLHISKKAHLIMPTHRILDRAYEAAKGKDKVGNKQVKVLVLPILIRLAAMVYVLVTSSATLKISMLHIRNVT